MYLALSIASNQAYLQLLSRFRDIYNTAFSLLKCSITLQLVIKSPGPQSRTLQPVRGEGYEPAHKSRANAETHPRLGVGGCRGVSGG